MKETEKEIEEMARIIKSVQDSQVFHDGEADRKQIATALYEAGYRKQSDTVKEFAEKALALCCEHHYSIATRNNQQGMGMFTEGFEQVLSETAAELAEQYGKEDTI